MKEGKNLISEVVSCKVQVGVEMTTTSELTYAEEAKES